MKRSGPDGNPVRSSRARPPKGERPRPTLGQAGRTGSAAGTSDREDEERSMKRFLLGALGTLGRGGLSLVQAANTPTMPKVADDPPPVKQAAPPSKEPPPSVTPKIPAEMLTSLPQCTGNAPVIDSGAWGNDAGDGGWSFVAGAEALYL